jgi:AcrR family transcriptional regulator
MSLRRPVSRRKAPARATIERPNARKNLVRDELVSRAAEVFHTRGLVQTNIADVARVLGLKRSSIYHYFSSKDDLLHAIVSHEFAVRDTYGAPIVEARDEPATPRLRRMLVHRIEREFTRGVSLRAFDQLDADVSESVVASVRAAHERGLQLYEELMRQGVARGEFRAADPRILALAVISLTNWSPWWLAGAAAMSIETIAAVLSELAVAAVRVTTPGAPGVDLGPAIDQANTLAATLRALQQPARAGSETE